jgi:two-component system, chemotaxis family, chemotaxis protein CheY
MALRILIVDDSPVMRRVVRKTIELSGTAVSGIDECSNGSEALAFLEKQWVDVVLTDVHMPVMTGDELIRRMAANPLTRDVAIIVISSDRAKERVDELTRLGVRAYLTKPFRPEQLNALFTSITETAHVNVA